VPANDTEALKTPLMGLFEKKRARNLYIYLDKVDQADSKTWGDLDLNK
jgi:Rab GDP dissociation inhibitor